MPRATKTTPTGKARHDPLLVQLREDDVEAKYGRVSKPGRRAKHVGRRNADEERADDGETVLDPKTSRKIFELARDQQVELGVLDDDEAAEDEDDEDDDSAVHRHRAPPVNMGDEDEDLEEDVEYEEYEIDAEDEFQIDSGDMQALDALLPANSGERRTLADLIFAKIEDAEANGGQTAMIQPSARKADGKLDPAEGLNPKVVEVYRKVGQLLSKYTSGPLPKPFKIVPSLPAWARILALTEPEEWSPQAAHAATRIFVSQMKPAQARVYLEGVLLDAVREDIRNRATDKGNRPLHPHYYEALRRAVYKPGAFFKGIVFPLLETGCTLKEAAIIASVLAKKKVPMLHSSAALLRLAEMEHYTGPNSLFIRVLIDKKYALPYKVVDALVFHFIRLSNTYKAKGEKLPVLWHQSLLTFCQRYSSDLTPDQKDALLDVIRATPHTQIGPEVRRELVNSVERGAPREPGVGGSGLDVEMG